MSQIDFKQQKMYICLYVIFRDLKKISMQSSLKNSTILWKNPTILFLYELLLEYSNQEKVLSATQQQQQSYLVWEYVNILQPLTKAFDAIPTYSKDKQRSFSYWQLNQSLKSRAFLAAIQFAREHKMDLKPIWTLVITQFEREQNRTPYHNLQQQFNFYTEAYSKFMGLIFKNGTLVINRSVDPLKMYDLGIRFGQLVYVLHAFEVYATQKKPNIFTQIFKKKISAQNVKILNYIQQYILHLRKKFEQYLDRINLGKQEIKHFKSLIAQWTERQLNEITNALPTDKV